MEWRFLLCRWRTEAQEVDDLQWSCQRWPTLRQHVCVNFYNTRLLLESGCPTTGNHIPSFFHTHTWPWRAFPEGRWTEVICVIVRQGLLWSRGGLFYSSRCWLDAEHSQTLKDNGGSGKRSLGAQVRSVEGSMLMRMTHPVLIYEAEASIYMSGCWDVSLFLTASSMLLFKGYTASKEKS